MPSYALGSQGETVRKIQEVLKSRGLYRGALDGNFGGSTLSGVEAFQRQSGLADDGRVKDTTWKAMFGGSDAIPAPELQNDQLARRCLALTGSFETGAAAPECFCGLSGDFDGQGISFGVLQWNFGQGSLQPLLNDMVTQHADVVKGIFGSHYDAFAAALHAPQSELMAFARSVQHPVKHTINEPWRGYAKALGRTSEFQQIQVTHSDRAFQRALAMCQDYALWSERAVALMFDIVTQNGSIGSVTRAQIVADFKLIAAGLSDAETETRKLEIVANRRAEAANPQWVDDVRRRKLCIARGEGTVHGIAYDLEEQFCIRLARH
ncbi:MAG TPA: peptidoglycan-binding domain-containing protein [Casimicrobiaceae bacterium]|jgi:hypothetical protein|nr:peptidoglycan-binding domain-containing protein [Casimicrobiaceae bacterium]